MVKEVSDLLEVKQILYLHEHWLLRWLFVKSTGKLHALIVEHLADVVLASQLSNAYH